MWTVIRRCGGCWSGYVVALSQLQRRKKPDQPPIACTTLSSTQEQKYLSCCGALVWDMGQASARVLEMGVRATEVLRLICSCTRAQN